MFCHRPGGSWDGHSSWSCGKHILGIVPPIGHGVILDASLAAQHETSLLRRDLAKLDKAFASVGDVVPCYLGQIVLTERRRTHLTTKEQTAHRMRFATTGLALVMGASRGVWVADAEGWVGR